MLVPHCMGYYLVVRVNLHLDSVLWGYYLVVRVNLHLDSVVWGYYLVVNLV